MTKSGDLPGMGLASQRIRRLLERLPEHFGEMRKILDELGRAMR